MEILLRALLPSCKLLTGHEHESHVLTRQRLFFFYVIGEQNLLSQNMSL